MKDLRKNLKNALIQVISELPEGGLIHSTKEGRLLVLSKLGVLDESYWGMYDRGVSVFSNNLSSVVYELKKKGLISVPKPLYWGKPAVQPSLFGSEEVVISDEVVVSVVGGGEGGKKKEIEVVGDGLTVEERVLKKLVDLKGEVVLSQAVKDMGGWFADGGCYGGYGNFPRYVCEGGVNGRGVVSKPCPLRSFCKIESGF